MIFSLRSWRDARAGERRRSCHIRELKQPRRRRRGRRQVKNEFIFYQQTLQLSRSVRYTIGSKNVFELTVQWRRVIPNRNAKN